MSISRRARELGGKNIRSRSQSLVDDALLIDLPEDSYWHFVKNGICGDEIAILLITHSHSDHLAPKNLKLRSAPYAHDMRSKELRVLLGQSAYDEVLRVTQDAVRKPAYEAIRFEVVRAFTPVTVGDYTITPLPARHQKGADTFIYVIQKDGKSILYAHDTGYFYDEVLAWLEQWGQVFDFVNLDCTYVGKPVGDTGGHMGIDNNVRLTEKLKELGVVGKSTKVYVNHFSHNGAPIQEDIEAAVKPFGFGVAYDGLKIEI